MPTFLASPSTLSTSGWTINTWNPVSVSGIAPPGSTAAILLVTNTTITTGVNVGVRATGSSDVWAQATNLISGDSQAGGFGGRYIHAPLSGSLSFDIYPSAVTNQSFQVVGFWGSEATFLSPGILCGAPGNNTYNTYNATTLGVPSGAPAVFLWYTGSSGGQCGARPLGSSDAYFSAGSNLLGQYGPLITALGTGANAGQFQTRTAAGVGSVYIMGYINSGTNFVWNSSAINVTPASSGSLVGLTQELNATAYIYMLLGPGTNACATAVIEGTATTGIPASIPGCGMAAQYLCGPNSQANLSTLTGMTLYELGYFFSNAPPVSPFTLYGLKPLLAQ